MAGPDFLTISDDLTHVAQDAYAHFENGGYDVQIEPSDIGFPTTPAFVATRGHERVIVEAIADFEKTRIKRWVDFCKSQTTDSRLCVVAYRPDGLEPQLIEFAGTHNVGLMVHNDANLVTMRPPVDLAVHAALPDLGDLKRSVRPILAPAFQKFAEGDWRDGLFAAYGEVEEAARSYLEDEIATGRIVLHQRVRRQRVQVTTADVQRMTLGKLAEMFGRIPNATHKEARIHQTLSLINDTRVGLAHRRRRAEVEVQVRTNAGQHIHAVTNCLEELL